MLLPVAAEPNPSKVTQTQDNAKTGGPGKHGPQQALRAKNLCSAPPERIAPAMLCNITTGLRMAATLRWPPVRALAAIAPDRLPPIGRVTWYESSASVQAAVKGAT